MNGNSEMRRPHGRAINALTTAALGLVLSMFGVSAMVAPAAASDDQPGGANGSVKIDGNPVDSDPSNEPHVECTFGLQFFGFDEGVNAAEVKFLGWPPTGDKTVLKPVEGRSNFTFEGGRPPGNTLNLTEMYELDFGDQQPGPQGAFHVKAVVTVTDAGGKVAFAKSKVFWVEQCAATPSPSPTATPTTSPTDSPTDSPTTSPTDSPTPTAGPSPPEPTQSTPAPPGPTAFEGGGTSTSSGEPADGGAPGYVWWMLLAATLVATVAGVVAGARRLTAGRNA